MSTFKFKVNITESESSWGSKIDEVKEFETIELAEEFIKEFNSENDADCTPDWYMYATRANYKI